MQIKTSVVHLKSEVNCQRLIVLFVDKSGQLMIEAMVALSMLTLGMIGIFALLSSSLGFNKISTDEYIASNLAAEGIEIVRNIIDANLMSGSRQWNSNGVSGINEDTEGDYNDTELQPSLNRFIKFDPSLKVYNYDSGEDTIFRRTINITNSSASEIKIKSTVYWKGRNSVPYEIVLEDYLFNWR